MVRQSQNYIIDVQSQLYEGDIVETDENARVHLTMSDGTRIDIAARSRLVLHQYVWQPGDSSPLARMTMTAGALHVAMPEGDVKRGRFEVSTPMATIGVRGAEFAGGFVFAPSSLDVVLLSGPGVYVTNDHGTVEIIQQHDGTTVIGSTAPQLPKPWTERRLATVAAQTVLSN